MLYKMGSTLQNFWFIVKDKRCSGQPKKVVDDELEALLDQGSAQKQEELAGTLKVTQQAVSI